jgi:hypothetical protein
MTRPLILPRVRTFRNAEGDVKKWIDARKSAWWFSEPAFCIPQKAHIYSALSRRTWKSRIRSIEVTPDQITVVYFQRVKLRKTP